MNLKGRQSWQGGSLIDAVVSVLSSDDPIGSSSDEIANALHWPGDGAALQGELEELVACGLLDRRGIGRGALYTLAVPAHSATVLAAISKGANEPAVHRAS